MKSFRSPILHLFMSVAFTTASALIPAAANAGTACEDRRELTMAQSDRVSMFYVRLIYLDQIRDQPQKYQNYLEKMLVMARTTLRSPEEQEKASDYVLYEQLKQALFETVGVDNRVFTELDRVIRSTQVFSSGSPREIQDGFGGMRKLLEAKKSKLSGTPANESEAASLLVQLAAIDKTIAQLELMRIVIEQNYHINSEQLEDKLAGYGQVFRSVLGLGVVGTTVAVSAPVVGAASGALGVSGMILAGCGIGAVGGGAASVLQAQYQIYTDALIESSKHNTSYSCELREKLEAGGSDSIVSATLHGLKNGFVAGCIATGAGVAAPSLLPAKLGAERWVTRGVVGAVTLATSIETVGAAKNGYLAMRSYYAYRALTTFQNAEDAAIAGDNVLAEKYLDQTRKYAQLAGEHGLNAILTGFILPSAPHEMKHAFAAGRTAIATLIAKSSDNAAVAVQMIMGMAHAAPSPAH